jgi:protease-4
MDEVPTPTPEGSRPPEPAIQPRPAAAPPPLLPQQPVIVQARPRSSAGWKIFAIVCLALLLFSLVFNPLHLMMRALGGGGGGLASHNKVGPHLEQGYLEDNGSKNAIAVIPIDGVISAQSGRNGYTMVDLIDDQLTRAGKDSGVKAVILKINSPGGEVLASDDIYRLIQKFQENTGKPVVASMGSLAASGGYYISAPCRWIIANELTMTGSIGVIMHGYNFRGLMDKVGVRPEVFKSGRFKDMLSPDKRPEDIEPEEREMIQSMVNETFDRFKSVVREGRGYAASKNKSGGDKGRALADGWEQYADGRILTGKEALRLGFVDELGNFEAAKSRAQKLAGISDANLIQYQLPFSFSDIFGLFGSAESRAIKVDLGVDVPRLQLGRMYFLCPLVLPR